MTWRPEATIGSVALRLSDPVPEFSLPGIDGQLYSLSDYASMPVAVVFSCCHCPYVIAWEDRLNEIARDYAGRAALLAINSNDHIGDTLDDMEARAREKAFAFPFLRDESQEVARSYGASRTPEVFAVDAEHRLVYHGAPDSSYQDPGGAVPHLRHALDAALEGRSAPVPETPPVGCTIKWRAD
jgi:peroxiredoxin